MESTYTIFLATLKENKEHADLYKLISELTFELSRKKIQRLKDEVNINNRIGELFELYCKALHDEGLKTSRAISSVIDGLLKATTHEKEAFLYKSIYEKEQLEKSIYTQKQQIRATLADTFNTIEAHIVSIQPETQQNALTAVHDTKLRGIEMLGILKETTAEALLTTLEKGSDIADTIHEITKNLTFQTIHEGDFTKQRMINISSTIIGASIEIADEDLGHAKDILDGSINGVREGITKAIEKFKNDLKYAPTDAMEGLLETDLSELRKDLVRIDEQFIALLEVLASQSEGISASLVKEMIKEMTSSTVKIKRAANDAKEVIGERIEQLKAEASVFEKTFKDKAEKKLESLKKDVNELEKKASAKVESFKQFEFENDTAKQVAQEAKKLGFRAWEVAKNMMDGAVKGAKEAMKKEDK
ncbi:hypothetical protein FA592_07020 [Sulfurospirillum diekertiae]|uniref:Uncharacterized protein n=1 Tax=Sulfurospirillum diekertiae TaxID=1854492 RepID=A0A6G9VRL9_9BACT|nr:DUF6781 family protein [Sulfurospirillum diekertiae]QIR75996.1 hypothetical protein FA584_07140 [Sulfurospirillum diekertiae]QIR78639.1 hypothetical protein FA592_07020 [Sulfurospirillum diekertiae]